MQLVIGRKRPEAFGRWRLALGEGHGVTVGPIEARAVGIKVLVEILCFVWRVYEDVGFRDGRSGEIVGAEISPVSDRASMIGKLLQLWQKIYTTVPRK